MIGDLLVYGICFFKQLFCLHVYKEHIANTLHPLYYQQCKKCGRIRQ